ncbi:MAG TPA: inner membrane CreD family protein, partial [Steroidobacteraceae bacterium]|nr:inner membrane CreD family protein [Steroidobacteraceae bacterium]
MNRSLLFKLGAIGLLTLLLIIPLIQISNVVNERQHRRDAVVQDIARSSSYSQTLTGPLLVVPYRKIVKNVIEDATTHTKKFEEREITGELYFLPDTFNLEGSVKTEERSRGIYVARLYHANNKIDGAFKIPAKLGIEDDYASYAFGTAYITLGISDIRGIEDTLTLSMDEKNVPFEPGSFTKALGTGVHATLLDFDVQNAKTYSYHMQLKLQGTSDLQITPVGRTTKVVLNSDWSNPSFAGEYLP